MLARVAGREHDLAVFRVVQAAAGVGMVVARQRRHLAGINVAGDVGRQHHQRHVEHGTVYMLALAGPLALEQCAGDREGGGGAHAYEEKIEPKKQEMIEFAKRIADYLDDVRKTNKLNKLLIVAAPAFMGELRTHLSNETREKIVFELDKNIAHESVEDIRKHLSNIFS